MTGLIIKKILVATLMQISHALFMVMGKNRENSLSEHSVCFLESGMCACFVICCLFLRVSAYFQIGPKRALCMCESHVECLHAVLCRGYGVQGWALPSLVHCKFRLACHWSTVSAVFLLAGRCFLDPAFYHTVSMWHCLHLSRKFSVSLKNGRLFLECLTSLSPFSNLSSTSWQ